MSKNIFPIADFNEKFNNYLPSTLSTEKIYQSVGLRHHIEKRHPNCLKYLSLLPDIIQAPDYIGVNPNETSTSFELVKCMDNNIQIGIKLDMNADYLYVATLHTITESKLKHGIQNGRLQKFDKT